MSGGVWRKVGGGRGRSGRGRWWVRVRGRREEREREREVRWGRVSVFLFLKVGPTSSKIFLIKS